MIKSKKKRISVIEVLTTVSIVVIITVIVLPQFSKIKERQALNNSASTVITALNKASSQTLASIDSYVYGVRFNANSIVVFRGTTYAGSTLNETIYMSDTSTITNVTLNGTSSIPGEMYFNRLTNIPSKTGTVTITTGSSQKIITIGATGIVSVSGTSPSSNYNLNVTVSSGGTVTSNPGTINCGSTCVNSFASGTAVVLTATPSGGYTFSGWSGDCAGTGTCNLSMNANKSATATFAPSGANYNLNVTVSSGGTVTSNPGTINCGSTCVNSFASGTAVVLTAAPSGGYTFSGWSGDCSGTSTCNLTMNAVKNTTATFALSGGTNYNLNVTVSSGGTVTSNPGSIICDPTCSNSFSSGDIVTLTASPNKFYTFSGWSGACRREPTEICELTMDATKNVTATFSP